MINEKPASIVGAGPLLEREKMLITNETKSNLFLAVNKTDNSNNPNLQKFVDWIELKKNDSLSIGKKDCSSIKEIFIRQREEKNAFKRPEENCESPASPGGTTEELLHQEKNDKSPEGIPKLPEGPPAKIRKGCGGDMGNPIEEIKEKVKRVWQDISTDRWTFMTTKEVERQMAMARDDLCLVVDFLETLESKKPVLSIWEFQLGEAVRLADILHQKKGQDYGHFSEYPPIVLASLCFVKAKRILAISIKRANTEGDQGNVETFESMKDSCLDLLNYSRFLYAIDSVRPLWRI